LADLVDSVVADVAGAAAGTAAAAEGAAGGLLPTGAARNSAATADDSGSSKGHVPHKVALGYMLLPEYVQTASLNRSVVFNTVGMLACWHGQDAGKATDEMVSCVQCPGQIRHSAATMYARCLNRSTMCMSPLPCVPVPAGSKPAWQACLLRSRSCCLPQQAAHSLSFFCLR
jgi:hypothetical protein